MVSLYVKRLLIGCEHMIGRCHLQASKVRRDDDDRRPVWRYAETGSIVGLGTIIGSSTNDRFLSCAVDWRIWAALNLHDKLVCISRLEIIVCLWMIGMVFQTFSIAHWLCRVSTEDHSLALQHDVMRGKPYSQIMWFHSQIIRVLTPSIVAINSVERSR